MFQDRSVPPVWIQARKRASLLDPRVEHLPHLNENIVLRKRKQRAMNCPIVADIRWKVAPVIEDKHLVVKNAQLIDLFIRCALAGKPRPQSLYMTNGLIKIFDG